MTSAESDVELLRRAFADAGIDSIGIDLNWLAALKSDTEHKIAAARAEPTFASARPTFVPPSGSEEVTDGASRSR